MLLLAKFSEEMMTIYTNECIKNMPTWNHVNKNEVKRSRTAFVFTLTSFITSKRNKMKFSSTLQVWKVLIFPQLQAKKVGGVSPLPKMKLNEYLLSNLYCLVLIRD